jgi:hypothetical protein
MARFLRTGEGGSFHCAECGAEFALRLISIRHGTEHPAFGAGALVSQCPFCVPRPEPAEGTPYSAHRGAPPSSA